MKGFSFVLMLALVALSTAASIDDSKKQTVLIDGVSVNDLVLDTLRSGKGKLTFEVKNDGGKTTFVVNGEGMVWSGKNGFVSVEAGMTQPKGGSASGHIGVKGEINWKK